MEKEGERERPEEGEGGRKGIYRLELLKTDRRRRDLLAPSGRNRTKVGQTSAMIYNSNCGFSVQ